MRERSRKPRAGRNAWVAILVVILLRAAYALWLVWSVDAVHLAGEADLDRRLYAADYWSSPGLEARGADLLLAQALPALVIAASDDLLLAPAWIGTLAVILLLVGLAGICREWYPEVPSAAVLTVLLVAFSPSLSRLSLTTQPETLVAGLCALCWWGFLVWLRTHGRVGLYSFGLFLFLALATSFDAWILTLPTAVYALGRTLRRPRRPLPHAREARILVGLALLPVLVWSVRALARETGLAGLWLGNLGLGPLAAGIEPGFGPGFTSVAIGAPLVVMGLPMIALGRLLPRPQHLRFGRLVGIGLTLLTLSVWWRSPAEEAAARLQIVLVLSAPFVAGSVLGALHHGVERRALPMTLIWVLVLVQVVFSIPAGPPPVDEGRHAAFQVGSLISRLYEERVLDRSGDLVVLQDREHNDTLTAEQRTALGQSRYVQLFARDRIRTDAILPATREPARRRRGQQATVVRSPPAEDTREWLSQHAYRLIVAFGRTTRRVLGSAGYQEIGSLGAFSFLAAQGDTVLCQVVAAEILREGGTLAEQ